MTIRSLRRSVATRRTSRRAFRVSSATPRSRTLTRPLRLPEDAGEELLRLLARYVVGDRRCWRVVRVPSVAEEDARQLHRTWETLQGDRTRVINRLKAVLATHGVRLAITADSLEHVAVTRVWDGSEIPSGTRERLAHDWAQLQTIEEQLAAVKAARARLRIDPGTATGRAVQALHVKRGNQARPPPWALAYEGPTPTASREVFFDRA